MVGNDPTQSMKERKGQKKKNLIIKKKKIKKIIASIFIFNLRQFGLTFSARNLSFNLGFIFDRLSNQFLDLS
jgi:hypothetical protein